MVVVILRRREHTRQVVVVDDAYVLPAVYGDRRRTRVVDGRGCVVVQGSVVPCFRAEHDAVLPHIGVDVLTHGLVRNDETVLDRLVVIVVNAFVLDPCLVELFGNVQALLLLKQDVGVEVVRTGQRSTRSDVHGDLTTWVVGICAPLGALWKLRLLRRIHVNLCNLQQSISAVGNNDHTHIVVVGLTIARHWVWAQWCVSITGLDVVIAA